MVDLIKFWWDFNALVLGYMIYNRIAFVSVIY